MCDREMHFHMNNQKKKKLTLDEKLRKKVIFEKNIWIYVF